MKKFIVLLLVALMIVGLCVSCKEDLPVAPEEIVDDVVINTMECYDITIPPVVDIAVYKEDPDLVAVELEHDLKDIFASATEVNVDAETDSLSIKITAEVFHLSISITKLSYSGTEETLSFNFSISMGWRDEGVSKTMDVKGSFKGVESGEASATYSEVKFDGKNYDLKAFNEALAERLKPNKD